MSRMLPSSSMKISKSFKFKLIPTAGQKEMFAQNAGVCRFLYNLCLEHRILSWTQYRHGINYYDQANQLKDMKKVEGFEWLKTPPSQILQQSLKDLDRAFSNFFKGISDFPKFKKRGGQDSFRFPDPKQFFVEILTKRLGAVTLPKIGRVKYIKSRDIEGRIRNATISRDGDDWYISFNCEQEIEFPGISGTGVGIDRGIAKTIALSNESGYCSDELILPANIIKGIEDRIGVLQKRLRKMVKFSQAWKKAKKAIGKLHRKITRIRHDFLHKLSTKLTKNHSLLVLEKLKIKNMSKSASGTLEEPGSNVAAKSGLNRSILRQGWYMFQTFLEYKSKWYGSEIEFVPAHYSSQTCSRCSHRDSENRKSQEHFQCIKCGHAENADNNAAKVIFTRGQRGSACGGAGVALAVEAGATLCV